MKQVLIELAYEKGYRANEDGSIIGIHAEKLKLFQGSNGYLIFGIKDGKNNKRIPVHRFAAYCFFGNEIFNHECVRHINGIKTDNRKENLTLGSLSDNYNDIPESWRKDFSLKGAAVTRKLTSQNVIEIRLLLAERKSYSFIAEKFGVSKSTIQQIKEGKSYKWVI